MSNYSAKLLNNAVRSLNAQQAVLATIGNNIANVNTPGYARRVAELQTANEGSNSAGLQVGAGVNLTAISRQVDAYLQTVALQAGGDKASFDVQSNLLNRAQGLFSLGGTGQTIGDTISKFFEATNNLAQNPSSSELRSAFLASATDLVNSIKTTYNGIAQIQTEADDRIGDEIGSVNSITSEIAELNGRITGVEASGKVAADERDRREQLLEQLGQKMSFNTVENSDGTVTVSLSNGFALVSGTTARALEITKNPSFKVGSVPPSLAGGALNYIVYNYGTSGTPAHLDLSQVIGAGSGTIGGLLATRGYNTVTNTSAFSASGPLVAVASRVEALARQLLTSVNTTYLGPDRDAGTAGHQASSGDLNGNTPAVFGLFDFTYGGTKDADGNGLPSAADLTASGIDNFASRLSLTISNPSSIAAARDSSGGPPAVAVYRAGDGRNMEALAALENTNYTFAVGSYSLQTTFTGAYGESVGYIGNAQSRADLYAKISAENYANASNRRDEVQSVNLDEEFTNLIKYQKAFEASAKIIKVGDTLLDTIVGLL